MKRITLTLIGLECIGEAIAAPFRYAADFGPAHVATMIVLAVVGFGLFRVAR